jgi:RNA polymerase sigma-70 factor (ECF subfamily)
VAGAKPPFEELYREFLPRIYAYVRVQVGSTADAEDVTSEVFIHAYEAYGRYRPEAATPAAWLFRIARNATLDHYRRSGRRDRLQQTLARQPAATEDPSQLAEDRLRYADLLGAVARLTEGQREAISLRHVGLAFAEIGAMLDCSEDAAKMLYHRGIRALKEMVQRSEEGAGA